MGAGKSQILSYLAEKPGVRVMLADEIAHELMEPGTDCYEKIRKHFAGLDIFREDGVFDRKKLADEIFFNDAGRQEMNGIVHPAVREYVIEQVQREREKGQLSLLVLEAALLIEEHYDEICDELWYIYTREDIRRERLKASRGYSDARVDGIFASQLGEEVFRAHCCEVIDNNGPLEETLAQMEDILRRKING